MPHKLASLIRLRTNCELLEDGTVLRFVELLLKHSPHGSKTVTSGIFRQLYFEGESNDDQFLNILNIETAKLIDNANNKGIHEKSIDKQSKNFNHLADSLLSNIASYLPLQEILLHWNHVNRKFVEIGYKPETLQHICWQFDSDVFIEDQIEENPPKFKMDCSLKRLKSIANNCDFSPLFDALQLKSLKNVTIGNGYQCSLMPQWAMIKDNNKNDNNIDNNINMAMNNNDNDNKIEQYDHNVEQIKLVFIAWKMENKLFQLMYNKYFKYNNHFNNLKEISFKNVMMQLNSGKENFYHDVISVLQAIVPLCEKDFEIEERIRNEITDDMRKNQLPSQIKVLENQIKNDIEKKYNNNDDDNNDKQCETNDYELNKESIPKLIIIDPFNFKDTVFNDGDHDKWHSNIQILRIENSFLTGAVAGSDTAQMAKLKTINSMLTKQRIETSLNNLKCLVLHFPRCSYEASSHGMEKEFWRVVGIKILNNICCKLVSLHINPETLGYWQLLRQTKLCANRDDGDYGDVENGSNGNRTWQPANVTELCLHMGFKFEDRNMNGYFWHQYLGTKVFPKLKHLKIVDCLNSANCSVFGSKSGEFEVVVGNLFSLFKNGLKSFDLTVDKCQFADVFTRFGGSLPLIKIIQFLNTIISRFDNKSANYRNNSNSQKNNDNIARDIDTKDFSLKLTLKVEAPYVEKSDYDIEETNEIEDVWEKYLVMQMVALCKEILFLYMNLNQYYRNVMLGFKIIFEIKGSWGQQLVVSGVEQLKQMSKNNSVIFGSNSMRVIDHNVKQCLFDADGEDDARYQVLFAMVIKNRNKGESNVCCQQSHMEPRWEYCCDYCKQKPWLEAQ